MFATLQPIVRQLYPDPGGGLRIELEGGMHVHLRPGPYATSIAQAFALGATVVVFPPESALCACGSTRSHESHG